MNNSYREKYVKYKTKYLQLKNMIGSGFDSAKKSYYAKLNRNYQTIYNIFMTDKFLESKLSNLTSELPTDKPTNLEGTQIFEQIFNIIKDGVDKDHIDLICAIYLSGQLGIPNSIENKGRFIDNIIKFNKLKQVDRNGKNLIDFKSLVELQNFIDSKREIFEQMEEKKKRRQYVSNIQKKIKEEGEEDVEVLLNTDKVTVYHPTTEAGSKFYGRNTRWCTASDNNNMFEFYNDKGALLIIELKNKRDENNNPVKYQIHFNEEQIMNSKDEPVDINQIVMEVGDEEFNKWLAQEYIKNLNSSIRGKNGWVSGIFLPILRYDNNYSSNLKRIILLRHFDKPLGNSLSEFSNLQHLSVNLDFNQPLGDSLTNLTNLQRLELGRKFNQPLGDSLSNLTNLQSLHIGSNFNYPLGDSLNNLNKLLELTISKEYENDPKILELQKKLGSQLKIEFI